MEVILVSICTAIIIFITVSNLIRLFRLAYEKQEINGKKFKLLVTSSIVVGFLLTISLYIGYQKLWLFLSN